MLDFAPKSNSQARSRGTSRPSPLLGASRVPWLLVPLKPKEEVPATALLTFQSMMLLGMITSNMGP